MLRHLFPHTVIIRSFILFESISIKPIIIILSIYNTFNTFKKNNYIIIKKIIKIIFFLKKVLLVLIIKWFSEWLYDLKKKNDWGFTVRGREIVFPTLFCLLTVINQSFCLIAIILIWKYNPSTYQQYFQYLLK